MGHSVNFPDFRYYDFKKATSPPVFIRFQRNVLESTVIRWGYMLLLFGDLPNLHNLQPFEGKSPQVYIAILVSSGKRSSRGSRSLGLQLLGGALSYCTAELLRQARFRRPFARCVCPCGNPIFQTPTPNFHISKPCLFFTFLYVFYYYFFLKPFLFVFVNMGPRSIWGGANFKRISSESTQQIPFQYCMYIHREDLS